VPRHETWLRTKPMCLYAYIWLQAGLYGTPHGGWGCSGSIHDALYMLLCTRCSVTFASHRRRSLTLGSEDAWTSRCRSAVPCVRRHAKLVSLESDELDSLQHHVLVLCYAHVWTHSIPGTLMLGTMPFFTLYLTGLTCAWSPQVPQRRQMQVGMEVG
jgi:hypothetical protein